MGRGYSNSRCKSARPTLRMKRQRSLSMNALKESVLGVKVAARKTSDPRSIKESSVATEKRGSMSRTRSASTIRQRVALMEREFAGKLAPAEREEETVAKPDVMTKYKAAGRALDEVMDIVAAACVPGATTKQLCDIGDESLLRSVRGMFSKTKDADGKAILRGLSYPTNISVDHILCNHAPLTEEDAVVLSGGEVVKIHMGCHIDGYPVTAARTVLVPLDASAAEEYRDEEGGARGQFKRQGQRRFTQGASNAVEAARVALHGMIHLLRPGTLNADITDFIGRVGNYFEVQGLEGVLSNRTKRWVPDGIDCIIARRVSLEEPQQDVAECTIGENEVWTLDVAFTDHPSYKVTPADSPTTIFRRTEVEFLNDARVRSVNDSLRNITEKHQCFPFSLKHVEKPLEVRMAVTMLRKENVIDQLPVLRVKGERHITARFSATVAVTGRRVTVLCGLPPCEPLVVPDDVRPPPIAEDVAAVLAQSLVFAKGAASRRKKSRTEGGSD